MRAPTHLGLKASQFPRLKIFYQSAADTKYLIEKFGYLKMKKPNKVIPVNFEIDERGNICAIYAGGTDPLFVRVLLQCGARMLEAEENKNPAPAMYDMNERELIKNVTKILAGEILPGDNNLHE